MVAAISCENLDFERGFGGAGEFAIYKRGNDSESKGEMSLEQKGK